MINKRWAAFVARIKQAALKTLSKNKDGVVIVDVKIVVTAQGNPVIWIVSNISRVEPSSDATAFVEKFLAYREDAEV